MRREFLPKKEGEEKGMERMNIEYDEAANRNIYRVFQN